MPLGVPGAELPHVHLLRTLADSRALIAAASGARRGRDRRQFHRPGSGRLAASRGLDVYVVAPEARPMERVMGAAIGDIARSTNRTAWFPPRRHASSRSRSAVTLSTGERLAADLVVVGIGVRPATHLPRERGLAIDRGVLVNEYLQTSAPGCMPPAISPAGPTA